MKSLSFSPFLPHEKRCRLMWVALVRMEATTRSAPMNLRRFLLISKDSRLRQLVEAAAPQTEIHSTDGVSEGLALWSGISPNLVVGEGNSHTLAPLLEYASQTPEFPPLLAIGERHSVKEAVEIMRAG